MPSSVDRVLIKCCSGVSINTRSQMPLVHMIPLIYIINWCQHHYFWLCAVHASQYVWTDEQMNSMYMYFIGKRSSGSTDTCQRCVNCHWLRSDSWRKGMCVTCFFFYFSLILELLIYLVTISLLLSTNKRSFLSDPMHGSTKPWFPVCPLDKQLSNFVFPGQVYCLTCSLLFLIELADDLTLPLKSNLPIRKVYFFWALQCVQFVSRIYY